MLISPKRLALGLVAASIVGAAPAAAQLETGSWSVSPRAGFIRWNEAAGFENTAFVGLDAAYHFTNFLSIGPSLSVARPETRGEDFPAALRFGIPTAGDTTLYFQVVQPVTVLNAALNGTLRLPISQLSPYVTGGGGVYTLFLNPAVSGGSNTFSGPTANVGGGITIPVGARAGIILDVRDQIFFNYDRSQLAPTESRFLEGRFLSEFATAPEDKETLHNINFSIGFSFSPRRGAEAEDDEDAPAPANTPSPTPQPPPPGDAR